MNYKIVTNLPNIPDYRTFSQKVMFDPKEAQFDALRTKVRFQAIDQLGMDKQHKDTADVHAVAADFDRYRIVDHSVIDEIATTLGLTKPSARVQVLSPGQMSMLHVDDLEKGYISPVEDNISGVTFTQQEIENFKANPRSAVRFLIMLEDNMPGQLMTFGDDVISSWKKGDVIYWDWPTVVHSTVNTGFWARPLLRLTGLASPLTQHIIND